jgi:Putative Ig domain
MHFSAAQKWTGRAGQLLAVSLVFCALGHAQQAAATGEPLAVRTTNLPKAYVRQTYEIHLMATGGITPHRWELSEGALPSGISLHPDGLLTGTPAEAGEFRFTVRVTDSGKPASELTQKLTLLVVAPLMAQWGRYPRVNGQRLEGSIVVANQTDHDFDLTVIMLAVNETGRATTVGYQHFPLKKNTEGVEIPFGENLPNGSYDLNVDAVAEVAETNSIYRTRLVPKEKFQIQQKP